MSIPEFLHGDKSIWFWTMMQAVTVALTLFLIWRQVRLMRLANMLVALQHLDDHWNSEGMENHRAEFCTNPLSGDTAKRQCDDPIMLFFEDIGMQMRIGLLDKNLVWDKYSKRIEHYWPIAKRRIDDWRRNNGGDKTIYEDFQKLSEKMSKRSLWHGLKAARTDDEILRYAKLEQEVGKARRATPIGTPAVAPAAAPAASTATATASAGAPVK